MNSFIFVVLAVFATAQAGLIGAPVAEILQGPSSRTTLVGPEGSVISSVQPGGTVVADQTGSVVLSQAPSAAVVSSPAVSGLVAAPGVLATRAGLLGSPIAAQPAFLGAPVLARSGLVANGLGGTVIAGPSGTISTAGHPLAYSGLVSPYGAPVW